jgi:putative transposon-encoded protein
MQKFKIKKYRFRLKHDHGVVHMAVFASSEHSARIMIQKAENCPERAIKRSRA